MDIVDAYVTGFEVIARLGEAMNFEHYDAGWHSTATLGAYGAAASVSRLKRLDGHAHGCRVGVIGVVDDFNSIEGVHLES